MERRILEGNLRPDGNERALTTAYHPQADGQTKIMNQTLEISLRAYIGPDRDDWVSSLDGLALSYNSTHHTATRICTCLPTQRIYSNHWIQLNSLTRKCTKTFKSD